MPEENFDILVAKVAGLILEAKKAVVFTGAGISTESGIPDFRSPGGIWERYNPDDFTYQKFIADPNTRRTQWRMLHKGGLTAAAKPNPAHLAIAELDRLGRLDCVITQNVDNLHQRGGLPDEKVFELHGNMLWAVCLGCGRRYPFTEIRVRLDAGEETPDCTNCGGILKPDAVFFGEPLPEKVLRESTRRSLSADLFIVIGSTLVVYPAALMPSYAVQAGAKLVIINLSPTPIDRDAHVVIRAKAGETMLQVIQILKAKLGI